MALEGRESTLTQPTSLRGKLSLSFLERIETLIARLSKVGDRPIFETRQFPWAAGVEKQWPIIREELEQVMARRGELPNFHEVTREVEPITQDDNWKTFFFYGYGFECEENCRRCPETARALKSIPGLKTAFFSILSPNKHIPPHRGPYNGVLRYHLGLIVPEPNEQCRIRIADNIRQWKEGESLIFDDTYDHQVWNDTEGFRTILFADFVRPTRFPANLLNWLVLKSSKLFPAIREAKVNYKNWEKSFYQKSSS